MRAGIPIEDLLDMLELPLLATLATYDKHGIVLLSPVWYEWWEGGFNVVVGADDVKSGHLRHDPRATLVVAEAALPLRGLEIRAEAVLSPSRPDVDRRIAARYLSSDRLETFLSTVREGTLVRLVPGRLRTWDFRDEYE